MRILFSMYSIGRGGVTTAFGVLARYLESLGHEVKVVQDCRRLNESSMQVVPERYRLGWTPEMRCPIPHVGRLWLWLNCLFDWALLLRGRTAWRGYDYDCFVLFNGYDLNAYIMRFARRRPSVMWLHEVAPKPAGSRAPVRRLGFTRWLMKRSCEKALRGFDEYVAVSRQAAETQRVAKGLATEPKVICNLIDIPDIDEKARLPQDEIVKGDVANIIYLGRLSPEKGVDRLIDALAELRGKVRPFRLWIIGDDYYISRDISQNTRIKLERQVGEMGLSDIVTFLGDKPNPYPYVKAADLMVLPSRVEGMGLVIWESLLCGTPVLATDSGGPREALNGGRWGAIVENSTEGIKCGIVSFLEGRLVFDMGAIRAEIVGADAENRCRIKELFDGIASGARRGGRTCGKGPVG